ncbi:MAG: hypothetical protein KJ670_13720 [Alphaproteobacteria bacterium]|nr:hypothetical protein [Rhizobiaceae bacterium]MBU3959424.1 hypothetical protein [Alphaproteobacteria bacterium]MBU4049435.1 hypothetical protein [Alphaproteobacteria bacterium]MBU4089767.1 hypothetical protein [Alphaproteobacteria bacterium]MBU4154742.1 hypothetical protein [Alphaproteobacteria bacterium]
MSPELGWLDYVDHHKNALLVLIAFFGALSGVITLWWNTQHAYQLRVLEFRERWIDGVRDELSKVFSKSLVVARTSADRDFNSVEYLVQLQITANRLRLTLNPSDPNPRRFDEALTNYLSANTQKEMDECQTALFSIAQTVLSDMRNKAIGRRF